MESYAPDPSGRPRNGTLRGPDQIGMDCEHLLRITIGERQQVCRGNCAWTRTMALSFPAAVCVRVFASLRRESSEGRAGSKSRYGASFHNRLGSIGELAVMSGDFVGAESEEFRRVVVEDVLLFLDG